MIERKKLKGFYFITDRGLSENGIMEDVRQALSVPVAIVQYREKDMPRERRLEEAREIKEMCARAGVPFIVNDDVGLAAELDADGVHVGKEDMPLEEARKIMGTGRIIGVSVLTAEEAASAEQEGADYAAVSPVFITPTKPEAGAGVGIQGIKKIREATKLPLAAIGGINQKNANQAIEAGADMVCAISASLKNGEVAENIKRMMGQTA